MTTSHAPAAATRAAAVCCRRPMSTIAVTAPLTDGVATLALHSCSACGRHVWERDGEVLDRSTVLGAVRERIAEGPAPRVPRARTPRASRARVPLRS
jgi:hypothetical protein